MEKRTEQKAQSGPARPFSVDGQKVTVVGGARSGIAAALLVAGRGARVTLTDLRPTLDRTEDEARLREAGIALELGAHPPETFDTSDLIVLSPGVPLTQPQVAETDALLARTTASLMAW